MYGEEFCGNREGQRGRGNGHRNAQPGIGSQYENAELGR